MEKARRVMRVVVAVLSVVVCLALCVQAIGIYMEGNAPENFSSPGVRIHPVYSREIVSARLKQLMPLFIAYLVVLIAAVCIKAWRRPKERLQIGVKPVVYHEMRGKNVLRAVLYVGAAALVIAGIANGGMRDVLIKAINICTECIGLG